MLEPNGGVGRVALCATLAEPWHEPEPVEPATQIVVSFTNGNRQAQANFARFVMVSHQEKAILPKLVPNEPDACYGGR